MLASSCNGVVDEHAVHIELVKGFPLRILRVHAGISGCRASDSAVTIVLDLDLHLPTNRPFPTATKPSVLRSI